MSMPKIQSLKTTRLGKSWFSSWSTEVAGMGHDSWMVGTWGCKQLGLCSACVH